MKNTEQRQRILENLVYALAWIIVFAVPVLHFDRETGLNWDDISREWMIILPFFMLFCVHNYLLLPFFLLDKKPWQYLIVTLGVILVIFIYNPFETRQTIPHPRPFTERPFENAPRPGERGPGGERFAPPRPVNKCPYRQRRNKCSLNKRKRPRLNSRPHSLAIRFSTNSCWLFSWLDST